MVRSTGCMFVVFVLGFTSGCNQNNDKTETHAKFGPKANLVVAAAGGKYLLEAEPVRAKSVLETRKQAKDGDEIVMVGRIAGSEKPFVEGRAAFLVTDLSVKPCGENEGCPTPWDCCCTPKEELLAATAQVRFTGDDGKTLGVGGKELLGVKELTVVVVRGKASRDKQGNLTVIASGLYPRKS